MANTHFKLLSVLAVMFAGLFSAQSYAAVGTIKAVTSAPTGTKLRIQTYPYDATVTGVESDGFNGTYLSNGPGTEITISADGLGQLEIYGCELTQLEIVSAPDLYILKCYDNKIENLDLTGSGALEVLDCHNNLISKLDVSGNSILRTLNAGENSLTALTLGKQPKLTELYCRNNPLTELDVTGCPELTDLYFQNCGLTNLNLSQNSKLEWVFAYNNHLAGETMDNFIANMAEARTTGLIYIVDTRAESESNVCTMDDVRAFAMKGWATMDYLGGNGSDTELGKFYPGVDYVPTVSDRKISLTTTRQAGETITLNIKSSANISISGVKEDAISGKQTYTLTSNDVEILGDVTLFECPGNDITALSFSDPTLLTYIECQNNKIEKLDLTGARALTALYAQNNKLTSLNVTDCNSLMRLDCYQNQLKGNGMKAFINSLYQASKEPYLFIIDTKANGKSEGNIATTTDVALAKEKGWAVFDYAGGANWGMGVAYKGSEPTDPELPEQHFTISRSVKDQIMLTITFSDTEYYPIVEGGRILGWNGSGLTVDMTEPTLKIYGDATEIMALFQVIENIDVTNLPNLTSLNVGLNDIKTLDLSGNPKLTTLSCECNLLTALDVSSCPQLDYINCYGNQISGDGMTTMVTSLPLRSIEEPGVLIVYDQTYGYEGNICLKSDVAAARVRNWATYELASDGSAELILYEGKDPAGIEEVAADTVLAYDAAAAMITVATPGTIEVYAATGAQILKADNASTLSTASLPAGIYVVRAGNNIIKIKK